MKIGVVGLGFMGSTHLKAWRRIPGVEVAVVASDVERRLDGDFSDIRGNIGEPGERMDLSAMRKYADPFEAVRDAGIDIADICLPTALHADVTVAALCAGKHVLVEKPMALTGEEADRMVAAAKENGRVLMAAQVVRFIPSYAAAAKMIHGGDLGAVRSAIFHRKCAAPEWSPWLRDKHASGGAVFDMLIHDLDYCMSVLGVPEAVSAVGCQDLERGIDWITADLLYPAIGGVVVTGGWHHPPYPFSMGFTVIGDEGTLEYDSASSPLTLYRAGVARSIIVAETDWYQAEIEYFLNCCATGSESELCRPEDSARAVRMALLATAARDSIGQRISCAGLD